MTAGVLKQDPNTKMFKRTLIYFNTDTQLLNMDLVQDTQLIFTTQDTRLSVV